jgi:plasmid maintenance system antidote protein VapI
MQYAAEATSHQAFVTRVSELMKTREMSATKLSQLLEESESTVKNMLYKGTACTRERLIQLARVLETTVEYLGTGSELTLSDDSASLLVQSPEQLAFTLGVLSVEPPAIVVESVLRTLPMPLRLLSEYGLTPESTRAVLVNTDALKTVISRNDIILVDISQKTLHEGVYLISIRDSVVLRQVSPVITGFALTSTNPNILGTTVPIDPQTGLPKNGDTRVIAKVVCRMSFSAL